MFLALKALTRRPVRTLLSVLGVALGIATIVAFISIAEGFESSLDSYMTDSGCQLVVYSKGAWTLDYSRIAAEDVAALEAVEVDGRRPIEHIARGIFYAAMSPSKALPGLPLYGRDPTDRLMRKYEKSLEGRTLAAEDEVMLGSRAAEALGKRVGDSLEIVPLRAGRSTFKVVGIFTTGIEWEDAGALVHLKYLQQVLQMEDGFSVGFVYLSDPAMTDAVREKIGAGFAHLDVSKPAEFTSSFENFQYIDWFVWVISLTAVVVGGLGVLNTMIMSVSERVREIGVLRAVGWSKGRVARMILGEGFVISVLGGALGCVLGIAGAELIIGTTQPGVMMAASYTLVTFSKACAVAFGLGLLGSAFPAYQASRLLPAVALRYE